jgi:hypothetical protein
MRRIGAKSSFARTASASTGYLIFTHCILLHRSIDFAAHAQIV